MKESFRFYCNKACEYYPCHSVEEGEMFNCLFCYCPLYLMQDCGGEFQIVHGVKDCARCVFPHKPENYDLIIKRLQENKDK